MARGSGPSNCLMAEPLRYRASHPTFLGSEQRLCRQEAEQNAAACRSFTSPGVPGRVIPRPPCRGALSYHPRPASDGDEQKAGQLTGRGVSTNGAAMLLPIAPGRAARASADQDTPPSPPPLSVFPKLMPIRHVFHRYQARFSRCRCYALKREYRQTSFRPALGRPIR